MRILFANSNNITVATEHYQSLTKKLLLFCGILASLLYVIATVLGAMQWKEYDFTSQTVSELFAIGAPSKSLVDTMFIIYDFLWIVFGLGVWRAAGRKTALRVAAVGLIGKEMEGLIVQLFFPMHLRGVTGTINDPLHGILTFVGVFCFLVAMWFGATAFGKKFRLYSLGTLLTCMTFAILTGTQIPRMTMNLPTPWLGIWERITIFGYLLWGSVLAIGLIRTNQDA